MSRAAPEVIDIGSSDSDGASLDSEGEEMPAPVHGSPTPPPREVTLPEAIAPLSGDRVRAILTKVCATKKSSGAFVMRMLLHPINDLEPADVKNQARFQTCKHCKEEYEVGLNDAKSCRYHPGNASNSDSNSAERKRIEYDSCTWCFAKYDIDKNDQGCCKAHSGTKNVDYDSDFWVDHSDDAQGDPELCIV
ncbi:hypothetical protein B0A48_07145 [Cryoendolithus antarcticus]|uniref:C2H2-type domain-containing protein n=1 Tax=Cryoendolithus antarcticus TaxID=1507870 RepID=A0A1V8T895_9PEZI|nr:hypothetical protein B0A48_07145 [Cryoendolithus antarcticus]